MPTLRSDRIREPDKKHLERPHRASTWGRCRAPPMGINAHNGSVRLAAQAAHARSHAHPLSPETKLSERVRQRAPKPDGRWEAPLRPSLWLGHAEEVFHVT